MKRSQIISVLLGMAAVALAVRYRGEKPPTAHSPALAPAPVVETGRPLPPSFVRPGMVSRLVGVMRTYVAMAEEISFDPSPYESGDRAVSIPILIVLENETYRPLMAADMGWIGKSLCSVRVVRVSDNGGEVEVFQTEVPLPPRADWLSAERRSVTVDWPLRDSASEVVAGRYRVSVQLSLPFDPVVEIYTRLM
jgi:hypothetical protein